MAMQKKIITAGPLVMETIYPRVKSSDSSRARQAKKKASSEAQARMNHIYSWQKLKLLLAANLVRGDLVFTLTFSDERLPATREQVRRIVAGFRDKLSSARQTRGKRLVMFWNIEHLHGEGRWHIHCAANSTGNDYEEITRLWGRGSVDFSRLRVDREKNYETLARYMAKEDRDKPGLRAWSYTRNAKRPEVESFLVPDDTQLRPPKDVIVFQSRTDRNEFGRWEFVEYAFPDALRAKRTAARRRKGRMKPKRGV